METKCTQNVKTVRKSSDEKYQSDTNNKPLRMPKKFHQCRLSKLANRIDEGAELDPR